MQKLLTLMALLFLSITLHAQQAKNAHGPLINYKYNYIADGIDSIKCMRTPQGEWHKLSDIDKLLFVYASQLETGLDAKDIMNAGTFLRNLQSEIALTGLSLDVSYYEKELSFYKKQHAQQIENAAFEKHRKKMDQDSLVAIEQQQFDKRNRIMDSLREINEKRPLVDGTPVYKNKKMHVESDLVSHCITSSSYIYDDGKTERKIIAPAVVCFNNGIVSFYTEKSGQITFRVSQPVGSAIEGDDSSWTYLYVSEESKTMPDAWYTLQVIHSKNDTNKTAVLTYSRLNGESYIFNSPRYAASNDIAEYIK